jgi:hypothetical protein
LERFPRRRSCTVDEFGDDAVRFHTRVIADCGVLPEGYDGSWQRDRSAGWPSQPASRQSVVVVTGVT